MSAPQKTPISVLNELAIKLKLELSGQYLEVPMSTTTSESARSSPMFVYEYMCNRYIAKGEGTAKKRAQHNAAENMLTILKESPEFGSAFPCDNISLTSPSEIKVEKDAVGPLADFISEHMLPTPKYETVREEGPAHDKRFTSRCIIPCYAVEATDRQKKQAKQQVALQMLTMLKNTVDPRVNRVINTCPANTRKHDFEEALRKFPHCRRVFNTKYHPKDLSSPLLNDFTRYQDYHSVVTNALDKYGHLEGESPEEALDSILQKIEINYSLVPIAAEHSENCIVVLNIQFAPDLSVSEMGSSYMEASMRAARKALDYIRTLCSAPPKKSEEISEDENTANEVSSECSIQNQN